ncbi:hypothetical protein C3V44_10780 [Capnocytophaga sp. oral taxon 864]|nr:hypothetical protein C3V44_10780 [Capnocytophaga sp. oral taxon 864]
MVAEKMMKTSFYSESPLWRSTYPAVTGYLQKGSVAMGKREKHPPSPLQRGSVATEKGECGDGKAEKKRLMNEEIMSGG